ncbi:FAD dependent oxidoreductase protein [Rutstroemia sp. NJR-2017a BBW]|nr:FAD dependent oxidoreductase protein [Rutstroemia sp. NJR-2017a BBW]
MAVIQETAGQASLPTPDSTESFWHSEPSKVLLGHRTTSLLPSKADVVIIGSGIAGSSAAHWLKESDAAENLEVVMLEAREACWGATGRNGGHCQPLLYLSPPEVGAFELKTYENIKSLVEENNIQCDWKSLNACHAYMNEEAFVSAVKGVELLKTQAPSLGQYISVITKDSVNPSLSDLRVPTGHGTQNVNRDDYLTQRPFTSQKGGELMFGGGRAFALSAGVGISDDSVIDPPAADYLRRELPIALDLKNGQQELKASYEWSGIMGFSRDNWPWVGRVPEELGGGDGLYVCAGFTGHGMPTTRLSAKAVVEMMLGEEEVDLPGQYRVSQERIDSARLLDVVKIADEKGAFF